MEGLSSSTVRGHEAKSTLVKNETAYSVRTGYPFVHGHLLPLNVQYAILLNLFLMVVVVLREVQTITNVMNSHSIYLMLSKPFD